VNTKFGRRGRVSKSKCVINSNTLWHINHQHSRIRSELDGERGTLEKLARDKMAVKDMGDQRKERGEKWKFSFGQ